MQLITYHVRFINSTGSVTDGGRVTYLDSVGIKQVKAAVAQENQRAPENIILNELRRESV